ncbi:LytS/YhcK type 5TM receptor domain-containing protein [Peribacillus sp. NPDC097295]|uniref:LytS/YhcK type 5TM receptor domain-containing protein n=1 Tax=Peribacillus sp. NPDC097295 TaxID=3364402 RepID=UPI003810B124
METSLDMLLQLYERAALLLICLFFIIRIPRFKETLQSDKHSPSELTLFTIIFCLFAIFGTYSGIEVNGSLVNIRIIAVASGGILFGPWVGIVTGIISGLHRYLIDMDGITAIPCLITSIIAGIISGYINRKVKKSLHWIYGIIAGMLCEVLTMLLILVMAEPFELGLNIVSKIAFPMIAGEISIGFIVLLVMSVESEKEKIAAQQAQMALDIANKTLPYFRSINSESLKTICTIIKDEIKADAVAITDTENVLAYVGTGEEQYIIGEGIMNNLTKSAIESGEIIISDHVAEHNIPPFQYYLIMPLKEGGIVTGTLKVYFLKSYKITYPIQTMAIGLSQIVSTLMEVSRVEQIREDANKAELKALQTKINPHFLFNALNAIASTSRKNPEKSRELIINLASYMRFNLELSGELIDIKKELQQVKDYVEIEKARFGSRLQIEYIIDDVSLMIPSLLIQPLVENAINHGILKTKGPGVVTISVKDFGGKVRISVKDTGPGIEEEVIRNLSSDNVPAKKIGLYNVHQRVKLIYGKGLVIQHLSPGTEIYFDIEKVTK